jgi:hypothetical protein
MAGTSSARTTAPAPRRALDRLLSADEVAEFLGIPVATWAVPASVAYENGSHALRRQERDPRLPGRGTHESVRPGLLPS